MAANKAPEKYEAYIGIGQMSDTHQSELDSLYYCIDQAQLQGSSSDYEYLQSLIPTLENGELLVMPRAYVRKYGGAARQIDDNKDYMTGFLFGSEYNLLDVIRYSRCVAGSQNILIPQAMDNPLPTLVTDLDLPFYFIMGQYDYMTSASAAKNYFDKISAAKGKEYIIYENSAHYPQFEEKKKFYRWMCENFGSG